jgi:hypothetical protein
LGVHLLDKIPLQSQVSNQDVEIQTLDPHLSHHAEAVTDYFLTPGGLSKQKVKTTTHASEVASSK